MLLHERFPVPMYVECDQYGSQARLGIGLGLGLGCTTYPNPT